MDITKCDNCKKVKNEKERKDWAHINISGWSLDYRTFDFCGKCAKKFIGKLESVFDIKKLKIK